MQKYSQIFRTITDDVTGANKSIGLFGLSLQNVRNKLQEIQTVGFKNAIFNVSTIDVSAIERYNLLLERNYNAQKALEIASQGTNRATIALMQSANGTTVSIEQLTAAEKVSTVSAKALSTTYKALSVTGNMITFALIAKGIQVVSNAIDHFINRAKYAKEAMEEAQRTIDDAQSTLKETTSTVSEIKDRFLELSEGVTSFSKNLRLSEEDYAEYLSLSNQLAELFPSLVSGYDEQGNALLAIGNNAEETNKKLQDLLNTQKETTRQTLIDNMEDVAKGVDVEVTEAKNQIELLKNELSGLNEEYSKKTFDLSDIADNNGGFIQFDNYDYKSYEEYGKKMEQALSKAGIDFTKNEAYNGIQIDAYENKEQLKQAQEFYNALIETEDNYYVSKKNGLEKSIQEQENALADSYAKISANLQAWVQSDYNYQFLGANSKNSQELIDYLIPQIDWNEVSKSNSLVSSEGYKNYIEDNIIHPLMDIPEEYKEEIDYMFNRLLAFEDGDLNILPFAEQLQSRLNELGITIDITPVIADEQDIQNRLNESLRSISGAKGNNIVSFSVDDYKKLTEYTKNFNQEQAETWMSVTNGITDANEAIKTYEEALNKAQSENISASLSDWLNASQSGEDDDDGSTNSELIDNYISQINTLKEKVSDLSSITKDDLYELSKDFNDVSFLNIDIDTPEGLEELRKKLGELAKTECKELEDTLSKVEASAEKENLLDYIREVRDEVKDLTTAINGVDASILSKSISDITNQDVIKALDDINASMSALDSAYAEFKDKDTKNFSLDSLTALQEQFGNIEGFDKIIGKMDKINSSSADIQQAFDDIATAYINQSGILRTVNKDTADLVTAQLKEMGIANAEAVVQDALKKNLEELSSAKEEAKSIGVDLENVTLSEIATLYNENSALITTTQSLALYVLKKQLANKNQISTVTDVNNLLKVAQAAGIAVNAMAEVVAYKNAISKAASNADTNLKNTMSGKGFDYQKNAYEKGAVDSKKDKAVVAVEDAYESKYSDSSYLKSQMNINYDGGSKTKSGSGSKNSKSSTEKFSETIDWCAQSISVLTSNLEKLQSELDNTTGWDKQISKLKEIYKTNKNLTKSYKTNYTAYKNYYDKMKKIYSSTYKKYGAKIEKGETFNIESFKGKNGEKTYNQIQKMIDAYNQYTDAYNQYIDQKTAEREARDAVYQKQADEQSAIIEAKKAKLDNTDSYKKQKKLIEDIMSATKKQYQYELKLAKTQAEKTKLQQEYIASMKEYGEQIVESYWNRLEEKVEKLDKANELLNATLENTSGADNKNAIADQTLANEKAELKKKRTAVSNAEKDKDSVYNKIDAKYRKNTDEDGKISTDNLDKIPEAQQKYIVEYNAWINTLKEKEHDLAVAEQEYITAKANTVITHANNIITDADNKISLIEAKQNELEQERALIEAKGNSVSREYYKDQILYAEMTKKSHEEELQQLEKEIQSLTPGTDEWYEMYAKIVDCKDAIANAALNVQNFSNAIDDINLSVLTKIHDEFSDVIGEADFLISLLEDKDLAISVDDKDIKQAIKNGNFDTIGSLFAESGTTLTDEGKTVAALHGQNYNMYMQDAYKYKKQMDELEQKMKEDSSYNTEENRKQLKEWNKAWQQSILNAKDEEKTIKDLTKQGYQAQLDILKEIIDKKKESLNAEKALYDYQKNIKSKTKNIDSLKQQLEAWENVDTEEARNKAQQLQVELEDAQTDLEETIYERYLSDYSDLMDNFYEDYEDLISGYLDDTNTLLSDILSSLNGDESGISKTLTETMNGVGGELSTYMQYIWNYLDGLPALDASGTATPDADTGTGKVATSIEETALEEENDKDREYRLRHETPTEGTVKPSNDFSTTDKENSENLNEKILDEIVKQRQNERWDTFEHAAQLLSDRNSPANQNSSNTDNNTNSDLLDGTGELIPIGKLTPITDKSAIRKYINSKASKTDKNKKNLSNLNKYIYDKTDGKVLSEKEIVTLGNKYLGLKTSNSPTTKEQDAILKALKKAGYSSGGFTDELNKVIKENGDDGIVTLQRKELVLDQVKTQEYMKLMDNLDGLNKMFDVSAMIMQNNMLENLTPRPNLNILKDNLVPVQNDVHAEFNFTLPNVVDANSFLKTIQTDNRVQKAIQSVSMGRLVGGGKLGVNKIK